MKGLDGYEPHPARDAARASMAAVEDGDRAAWLGLFARDACVEDPAFYDTVIASGRVEFAIRESYVGGHECANVGTITTTLPDGSRAIVEGVYTYRVDDTGRIVALRAYWEPARMTLVPPDGS